MEPVYNVEFAELTHYSKYGFCLFLASSLFQGFKPAFHDRPFFQRPCYQLFKWVGDLPTSGSPPSLLNILSNASLCAAFDCGAKIMLSHTFCWLKNDTYPLPSPTRWHQLKLCESWLPSGCFSLSHFFPVALASWSKAGCDQIAPNSFPVYRNSHVSFSRTPSCCRPVMIDWMLNVNYHV